MPNEFKAWCNNVDIHNFFHGWTIIVSPYETKYNRHLRNGDEQRVVLVANLAGATTGFVRSAFSLRREREIFNTVLKPSVPFHPIFRHGWTITHGEQGFWRGFELSGWRFRGIYRPVQAARRRLLGGRQRQARSGRVNVRRGLRCTCGHRHVRRVTLSFGPRRQRHRIRQLRDGRGRVRGVRSVTVRSILDVVLGVCRHDVATLIVGRGRSRLAERQQVRVHGDRENQSSSRTREQRQT